MTDLAIWANGLLATVSNRSNGKVGIFFTMCPARRTNGNSISTMWQSARVACGLLKRRLAAKEGRERDLIHRKYSTMGITLFGLGAKTPMDRSRRDVIQNGF